MSALSRPLERIAARRGGRAILIAGLVSLLAVNVALAYSLFRVIPFAGSIFDTGKVVITEARTNDDGASSDPWDNGDNGLDPIAAAVLIDPYLPPVARASSNVQSCTVSAVSGDTVTLTMASTFDALRCAVKVRIRNASTRAVVYDGATVTGAPVTLTQDPYVGMCTPPGQEPSVIFELMPEPAAVPGTTWTTGEVRLAWHDVASCP